VHWPAPGGGGGSAGARRQVSGQGSAGRRAGSSLQGGGAGCAQGPVSPKARPTGALADDDGFHICAGPQEQLHLLLCHGEGQAAKPQAAAVARVAAARRRRAPGHRGAAAAAAGAARGARRAGAAPGPAAAAGLRSVLGRGAAPAGRRVSGRTALTGVGAFRRPAALRSAGQRPWDGSHPHETPGGPGSAAAVMAGRLQKRDGEGLGWVPNTHNTRFARAVVPGRGSLSSHRLGVYIPTLGEPKAAPPGARRRINPRRSFGQRGAGRRGPPRGLNPRRAPAHGPTAWHDSTPASGARRRLGAQAARVCGDGARG
jgi:hypothetical protein